MDNLDELQSSKVYSFDELNYLLENLSEEDKEKVKDYTFKMHEEYSYDDSCDVYYAITIYKDGNEIGKIDMYYNSNTYWDLIENESITDTTKEPFYTYTMILFAPSVLRCNKCKIELEPKNVKGVEFGRTYEMINGEEVETEYAYIECNKCGAITKTDSEIGSLLRFNLMDMNDMNDMNLHSNIDILYNFDDISHLLEHLSDADREKVKDCQFKVFVTAPDDDSGDEYDYITIFKDDIEIGEINMICHSNSTWDLPINEEILSEELVYGKSSYSYTMNLNTVESIPNKLIRKPQNIGFNTRVCKKCGQMFCDCNLKCKICGQVFCDCNLKCKICGQVFCEHKYKF